MKNESTQFTGAEREEGCLGCGPSGSSRAALGLRWAVAVGGGDGGGRGLKCLLS